jgi:pimeloyl-ACP methyl ester carboxylesterase
LQRRELWPGLAPFRADARCRDKASGAHDFLWPPAIGRQVAALIPGARFEVMEDAGHFPHLQAPETLVRLARSFLDG